MMMKMKDFREICAAHLKYHVKSMKVSTGEFCRLSALPNELSTLLAIIMISELYRHLRLF